MIRITSQIVGQHLYAVVHNPPPPPPHTKLILSPSSNLTAYPFVRPPPHFHKQLVADFGFMEQIPRHRPIPIREMY